MTDQDAGAPQPEIPGIDFSTFVLSLSTSALYQMGLVPVPDGKEVPAANLPLAQHTIETLKMIRSKTQGNLEPEEEKLLDSLLYELHSRYASLAK